MKKNTILIVDDNPTNLDVLFDYLDGAGFELSVAEDGESALERINYNRPDIILLDVMMPGLDGFETCRHLKRQPETKDIPIIFMTALTETNNKVKGFQAGAVDYITKPLQHEEVLARVTTHLTIQNLRQDLHEQNRHLQQEIGERKHIEKRLQHAAYHDALTNLPNRTLLLNRLEGVVEHAQKDRTYLFALLFLDMDGFKHINDSLGHLAGDQLLIEVARRLENCIGPSDMAARLGGDEFAILLEDFRNVGEAETIVAKICQELSYPFDIAGQQIFITPSIGITMSTHNYQQAQDILRDADIAMYHAKTKGKARYEFFDTVYQAQARHRLQLEADLRYSLDHQDFIIHYQPIISLADHQIVGVEALLRWPHIVHGLVPPIEFVPLAEETGLIVPLGEWLLRTACHQIQVWRTNGNPQLRLAVNISLRQFQQPDFLTLLKEILNETGLPPKFLELEITESITAQYDHNRTRLQELQDLGVYISIDDFGTGYSSLDRLRRLPINTLKIDQVFLQEIRDETSDTTIVSAIISIAHQLKLKVIAEGVENEAQLTFLQSQLCDEIQGFLFSQPVPAEVLTQFLKIEEHLFFQKLGEIDEELRLMMLAQIGQKVGYALADENFVILASNTTLRHWVAGQPDDLVGLVIA